MKNYYEKFCFLFFILSFSNIFADNCSDPALNCFNETSPYKYCYEEDGKHYIITYCVKDPLNPLDDGFHSGIFTPVKFANMPVCVEFINSGPDVVKTKICNNSICISDQVIYHKTAVENDIKYANNLWRCLCYQPTTESSVCNCTIKVVFVDENTDLFRNAKVDFSSNSTDFWKDSEIINNDCKISCNDIYIYLNNTVELTGRDPINATSSYYQFFTSSDIVIPEGYYPDGSKSIRGAIARELGKIFGFGSEQRPENGQCQFPANENERIMYEEKNYRFDHLSDKDKCMFKKLYCPTTLGGINEEVKNDFKDLQSLLKFENQFDKIIVYDLLGKKTIDQDFGNFNYSNINKAFDFNRFSIVFIYNDNLLIKTIKIIK
jgi:hypothetical protein